MTAVFTSPDAVIARVCVVVGWHRRWYAPSLPEWWAGVAPLAVEANRQAAKERATRVRNRVSAGETHRAVAADEAVHLATVARDLRPRRSRTAREGAL